MSTENQAWTLRAFDELSITELYQILRLRQQVFVVEQSCCYEDIDNWDQSAIHLMAHSAADQLLAYCRMFAPGVRFEQTSIGRVLTAADARHLKLGHELLKRSVSYCEEYFPGTTIRIDAQAHLQKFYGRYGFEVVGEEHMVDDIPHVTMLRDSSVSR